MEVANTEKKVPREWINEAGNGVNHQFVEYALLPDPGRAGPAQGGLPAPLCPSEEDPGQVNPRFNDPLALTRQGIFNFSCKAKMLYSFVRCAPAAFSMSRLVPTRSKATSTRASPPMGRTLRTIPWPKALCRTPSPGCSCSSGAETAAGRTGRSGCAGRSAPCRASRCGA